MNTLPRIPTPCIGLCSTTYGDSVCRGCRRFAHEIVDWNRYSEVEKRAVVERLARFIELVVSRFLVVVDEGLLEAALIEHGFRYRTTGPASWWAYDLLRHTKGRIGDPRVCGLQVIPEVRDRALPDIWEQVNAELLTLAEAHYARYFQQPLTFD